MFSFPDVCFLGEGNQQFCFHLVCNGAFMVLCYDDTTSRAVKWWPAWKTVRIVRDRHVQKKSSKLLQHHILHFFLSLVSLVFCFIYILYNASYSACTSS